ncbi:breakpoint cluster region, variant 2 [Clonorchis sinensis]|uniref:Breakpoint cluster region, variant 2 n=1 Tax=Clonorchis sinensis TaxID=79923 RepID=A0A8T1MYT0_CLOSI|nr:breakpoint cluster region, variant 2 [Clonorchis sinensis]
MPLQRHAKCIRIEYEKKGSLISPTKVEGQPFVAISGTGMKKNNSTGMLECGNAGAPNDSANPESPVILYNPADDDDRSDDDSNLLSLQSPSDAMFRMTVHTPSLETNSEKFPFEKQVDSPGGRTDLGVRRRARDTGCYRTKIYRELSLRDDPSDSEGEAGEPNETSPAEVKQTWEEKTAAFLTRRKTSLPVMDDRGTMLHYRLNREESKLSLLACLLSKFCDLKSSMNTDLINKAYNIIQKLHDLQKEFVTKFKQLEPAFDNPDTEVAEVFRCVIQRQEYLVIYHNLLTGFLDQVPAWPDITETTEEQKNHAVNSLRQTLQEPLNWLVQEAEDVKELWQITPTNNPDQRAFASLYERLITDSIESPLSGQPTKSKDSRKLRMHSLVVELVNWQSDERKLRYLLLFSDILVCAKITKDKSSKHKTGLTDMFRGMRASERNRHFRSVTNVRPLPASINVWNMDEPNARLETKWMIPLDQLKLSHNTRVVNDPNKIAIHERAIENLKSNISKMRNSMKRLDESKKRDQHKLVRSLRQTEGELVLQSPQLVLPLVDSNGQTHYILLVTERERNHWRMALQQEVNQVKSREECIKSLTQATDGWNRRGQLWPSAQSSAVTTAATTTQVPVNELNTSCRTTAAEMNEVLKKYHYIVRLNKTGMAILEEAPGRTGILRTTVHGIKGLDELDSYHVCIEVDSFAQFEEVARTHVVAHQSNPQWNETFDLQIDNAHRICFTIYRHADVFSEAEVKLTNDLLCDKCIGMPIKTHEPSPRTITFTFTLSLSRASHTIPQGSTVQRGKIFGHALRDLVRRDYDLSGEKSQAGYKPRVPKLVLACTDEVSRRGLREVGIYRICGSNNEIQALKDIFDQDQEEAMKRLATTDIFVVASLLKQFFREIPDGLITTQGSMKLMQLVELPEGSARTQEMQNWLDGLPRANRDTLIHMLSHLLTVSRYSENNKMDAGNLALLWSAALFPPLPQLSETRTEKSPNEDIDIHMEAALVFQKTKSITALMRAVAEGDIQHCEHHSETESR